MEFVYTFFFLNPRRAQDFQTYTPRQKKSPAGRIWRASIFSRLHFSLARILHSFFILNAAHLVPMCTRFSPRIVTSFSITLATLRRKMENCWHYCALSHLWFVFLGDDQHNSVFDAKIHIYIIRKVYDDSTNRKKACLPSTRCCCRYSRSPTASENISGIGGFVRRWRMARADDVGARSAWFRVMCVCVCVWGRHAIACGVFR